MNLKKVKNLTNNLYSIFLFLVFNKADVDLSKPGIYTCQIYDESIGRMTSTVLLKINRKLFND